MSRVPPLGSAGSPRTAQPTGVAKHGHIFTDDFYTDDAPNLWRGRELYIPDLASGRLVESPSEIAATIAAFSNTFNVSTCAVTGYQFLKDGAQLIQAALGSNVQIDSLIQDGWSVIC
jgi:hypothetical protein